MLLKIEISGLDWHTSSVDEVCHRLSTTVTLGLDTQQVERKQGEYGKNQLSPPPSCWLRKLLYYIFGNFGTLLIVAGILSCIAWKPLGEPVPQAFNLALGVILFIVAGLQAFFNGWQVLPWLCFSDSRTGVQVGLSLLFLDCFRLRLLFCGMEVLILYMPWNLYLVISSKSVLGTRFLQTCISVRYLAISSSIDLY